VLLNKDDLAVGAGMIEELTSFSLPCAVENELSTEPVKSSSGIRDAEQTFLRVRITELVGGRKIGLEGDYRFEQLPMANDQLVIRNRRGSYDIMKVAQTAHEGETTVYVRWVARR
jgi:hypothetical protein